MAEGGALSCWYSMILQSTNSLLHVKARGFGEEWCMAGDCATSQAVFAKDGDCVATTANKINK